MIGLKRFWYRRETEFNFSDNGFLYDPSTTNSSPSGGVTFTDLAKIPCLILLGEPGIGKTYTLQSERKTISTQLEGQKKVKSKSLWLDLRSSSSEQRLIQNLFQNKDFVSWSKGNHSLYVFLDNFDAALLRIDFLSHLLLTELQNYNVKHNFYLRIACRATDWPAELEDGLHRLWEDEPEAVQIYQLAPLRRQDVIEAAQTKNIDAEKFLEQVILKGIVPFAIKPITLETLLNIYAKNEQFPTRQNDIYFRQCLRLCEELDKDTPMSHSAGTLAPEQRLLVAAHIAALTVFCNRYAIWKGLDRGDIPPEDITIKDIYGGFERMDNGVEFQITDQVVKETLRTGLFITRAKNRIVWSHQTYAEYLAAWYFTHHNLSVLQIKNLLGANSTTEGRPVPQLLETAAWLANLRNDVFEYLVIADPKMLFETSNVISNSVQDRAIVVDRLLKLFDEEKLLDEWHRRNHYKKLAHPNLAIQLRPYICDNSKGFLVRRVAIDIAEECKVQDLQNDLMTLVMDSSQPLPTRMNALWAVIRIAEPQTRVGLKPLLLELEKISNDPDDQLRGGFLLALWPDYLSAKELFNVLTRPKHHAFGGEYQMFLLSEPLSHLQPADLPVALAWAIEQIKDGKLHVDFQELVDNITLQAWENLEIPEVLNAFSRLLYIWLTEEVILVSRPLSPKLTSVFGNDANKRQLVLDKILPQLAQLDDTKQDILLFYYCGNFRMLRTEDVPVLLEAIEKSSENVQIALARLVRNIWTQEQLNLIFDAYERLPALKRFFSPIFEPIKLNSPEAQKLRETLALENEYKRLYQKEPKLDPSPLERVLADLRQYEEGNPDSWWHLNMDMTLTEDSQTYGDEFQADLTALPVWKELDETAKKRIIKAARDYLIKAEPQNEQWLGTNTLNRGAFAGYRALQLLAQNDWEAFEQLPTEVWQKWATITLAYPNSNHQENRHFQKQLVKTAYLYAPDEILKALDILIDSENAQYEHLLILDRVEESWEERLADKMLNKVKMTSLKPGFVGTILAELLKRGIAAAKDFAFALIEEHQNSKEAHAKAIEATVMLVTYTPDATWEVIWPVIKANEELGREIISYVVQLDSRFEPRLAAKLTEEQLAELYIWVGHLYPYNEDPKPIAGEAYFVTPRHAIADWKQGILDYLRNKGTVQAVQALNRIKDSLSELDFLKWTLIAAQEQTRMHSWVPLEPQDLLKLVNDAKLRIIQNGEQLLEVVKESLDKLQKELQGITPASRFLWDQIGKRSYKPKDENTFSDYVKLHLERDLKERGIIANREVEIFRGMGGVPGEETDIYINAFVLDGSGHPKDTLTCIIEAKGCWHKELDEAMQTQLIERYLKRTQNTYGLYLVGWFNCSLWDVEDLKRKKYANDGTIKELREKLEHQAQQLSREGIVVRVHVLDVSLR